MLKWVPREWDEGVGLHATSESTALYDIALDDDGDLVLILKIKYIAPKQVECRGNNLDGVLSLMVKAEQIEKERLALINRKLILRIKSCEKKHSCPRCHKKFYRASDEPALCVKCYNAEQSK